MPILIRPPHSLCSLLENRKTPITHTADICCVSTHTADIYCVGRNLHCPHSRYFSRQGKISAVRAEFFFCYPLVATDGYRKNHQQRLLSGSVQILERDWSLKSGHPSGDSANTSAKINRGSLPESLRRVRPNFQLGKGVILGPYCS